jgi:hypothetical protein
MYVDLAESIDKHKKIRAIVEYFSHDYYSYSIDVLCLQGIKSHRILKELVCKFKSTLPVADLFYYPDVDNDAAEQDDNWSTSETEEIDFYDKLIVSRHAILSKACPSMSPSMSSSMSPLMSSSMPSDRSYGLANFNPDPSDNPIGNLMNNSMNNQTLLNIRNVDSYRHNSSSESDRIYDRNRVQITNINVNGTYVSIYNVELQSDVKGIRSSKERKRQLFNLKDLINQNTAMAEDSKIREYSNSDHNKSNSRVARNRNLHIVTGMFHIDEMRNNEMNLEYVRAVKILEGLDTQRWMMAFRHKKHTDHSNIRYSRDSYIMLISEPILDTDDLQSKVSRLYSKHKTLITNSAVMRNSIDMNYFTNYPIDTLCMVRKNKNRSNRKAEDVEDVKAVKNEKDAGPTGVSAEDGRGKS